MKNFKRPCGLFFLVFLLPMNYKHQPHKKKSSPLPTKNDKEKMSQNSLKTAIVNFKG